MYFTLIMAIIGLAEKLPELYARAKQSKELTTEEEAALDAKYEAMFAQDHWKKRPKA